MARCKVCGTSAHFLMSRGEDLCITCQMNKEDEMDRRVDITEDKVVIPAHFYDEEVLAAFAKKSGVVVPLDHKNHNVGESNYADFAIQPWDIWREYDLNPWDADIVKRILRTKSVNNMTPTEARLLDYEKIKHICDERIAQLKGAYDER